MVGHLEKRLVALTVPISYGAASVSKLTGLCKAFAMTLSDGLNSITHMSGSDSIACWPGKLPLLLLI